VRGLSRALRLVYSAALAVAGPLLVAGLALRAPALLEAGLLVVMCTPIVGALLVAGAMAAERDWAFTAVALIVLAILGSSLYAAAHLPKTPAAAGSMPKATDGR
jgi:uncharacterized membrane protein